MGGGADRESSRMRWRGGKSCWREIAPQGGCLHPRPLSWVWTFHSKALGPSPRHWTVPSPSLEPLKLCHSGDLLPGKGWGGRGHYSERAPVSNVNRKSLTFRINEMQSQISCPPCVSRVTLGKSFSTLICKAGCDAPLAGVWRVVTVSARSSHCQRKEVPRLLLGV